MPLISGLISAVTGNNAALDRREASRERRWEDRERRREDKHRRREERRRRREDRRRRRHGGAPVSSDSSSSSDSSDDERRHAHGHAVPGQGGQWIPQQHGFAPAAGYPQQPGYHPQGYPPQRGFQPPPGLPPQQGYGPPLQPSYPPQPGYAPPHGYPPQPGYPQQRGISPNPGDSHPQGQPQPGPPLMPHFQSPSGPPPGFPAPAVPPPGYGGHNDDAPSIELHENTPFPPESVSGPAPFTDPTGVPVFLALAALHGGLHPAKLTPSGVCTVTFGGAAHAHKGTAFLVPFDPARMEWVRAAKGQVPPGRRPVSGGREDSGDALWCAAAVVEGVRVPGKVGQHLGGASVAVGGREVMVEEYEMLCWRD